MGSISPQSHLPVSSDKNVVEKTWIEVVDLTPNGSLTFTALRKLLSTLNVVRNRRVTDNTLVGLQFF